MVPPFLLWSSYSGKWLISSSAPECSRMLSMAWMAVGSWDTGAARLTKQQMSSWRTQHIYSECFELSPLLTPVICPACWSRKLVHSITFIPFYILGQDSSHYIFTSTEPLAHGELLWSLDVRPPSCVVNNCFKRHLLLNYSLDFDQTWQEWSYMALFNNCSNGSGPLHI